jgi:hypothetical protein
MALVAAVIYPPSEIRDVVDQMAKHVARVGVEFEKKVRWFFVDFNNRFFLSLFFIFHCQVLTSTDAAHKQKFAFLNVSRQRHHATF